MKYIYHKAKDRGYADHGWLKTHHSFSFADFYDPEKVHFGALRVLNDDWIKAGYGFPKHPHDNMEIITIPLKGTVEHADTTGANGKIGHNEVQVMSAGKGIFHSERNPERNQDLELLQIWIFPREKNIEPRYDQKVFEPKDRSQKLHTIVASDTDVNNADALKIHQDAWLSLLNADKDLTINYSLNKNGNGVYIFVIDGSISVNGQILEKRDALGVWDTETFDIKAIDNAEVLFLEVPMEG